MKEEKKYFGDTFVNDFQRKPTQRTLVCAQTPSTTSTKTIAPSQRRIAVDTSDEKSTWPGESIKLRRYSVSTGKQKV